MVVHLTVRAASLPLPLTTHAVASWLWLRLRRAFPHALGAVLMPNHPHLVTATSDPGASRQQLKNVLTGLRLSDNPGAAIRWEPLGPAQELSDKKMINRTVRYLALNPDRAGLVDDPLCWPWSTHRDAIGAIADPWVTPARLAAALGRSEHDFAPRFHAYVSGDPSVAVAGTACPTPATPSDIAQYPLASLAAAAAAATRCLPEDIRRRGPTRTLFLQLAARHGWNDSSRLATLCGVDRRTVQRQRHAASPGLSAAELCLGDPRLRVLEVG